MTRIKKQCDIDHIHWNMHKDCNEPEAIRCFYFDKNEKYYSFFANPNNLIKIHQFNAESKIIIPPWLLYNTNGDYSFRERLPGIEIYPMKPLTTGEILQKINDELNKFIDISNIDWDVKRAIFGQIADHPNYVELITKLEKKELTYRNIFYWSREFEGLHEKTPNVFEVNHGT